MRPAAAAAGPAGHLVHACATAHPHHLVLLLIVMMMLLPHLGK
jgi:hypothetical protein